MNPVKMPKLNRVKVKRDQESAIAIKSLICFPTFSFSQFSNGSVKSIRISLLITQFTLKEVLIVGLNVEFRIKLRNTFTLYAFALVITNITFKQRP